MSIQQWMFRGAVTWLLGITVASALTAWIGAPNRIALSGLTDPMPPSVHHVLGTDDLGRDLASRLIDGARVSLFVGLVAMAISVTVGTAVGLTAGFAGGWIDEIAMRTVDFVMGLPTLFLILIIQSLLGPSVINAIVVIGATSWMGIARLVRADILSIRERPFILAARARGISPIRVAIVHALPSAATSIIVSGILAMGGAILTESVLSFLGLGIQPPQASWGSMLQHSSEFLVTAPWMAISPGLAITITVVSLNVIGDTLRRRIHVR